jgi:hypothetical protein
MLLLPQVGSAIWDGQGLHDLGTYDSDSDALQAAQASLNVLAVQRRPYAGLEEAAGLAAGPGGLAAAAADSGGQPLGAGAPPAAYREDLADGSVAALPPPPPANPSIPLPPSADPGCGRCVPAPGCAPCLLGPGIEGGGPRAAAGPSTCLWL